MAVRTDGTTDYVGRSASFPDPLAVTMCGWADMVVDRANFSSICCLTASPRTNGQLCLQTAADGNTFNLWYDSASIGAQEPSTGYVAAVGVPFFWALSCGGTGANQVKAYFRTRGSNTFNVSVSGATGIGAGFTPVLMRFGNADTSEFWNGRIWNVKVWDRELSSKELLIESFYRQVMFPANLHLHYQLRNASDTLDYSGNGKTATFNGSLTSEASSGRYGLWTPRRQLFIPIPTLADRTVNATTQSLTLTGQAATVNRTRGVAAATEVLELVGQPATVGRERGVLGSTQALTLTGQPATVVRGTDRSVVAATAVLTLTAQPATVLRGGVAAKRPAGGGFPLLRVPVYDRRIEQLEELIDDIETAAAGSPPAEINKARIELQRMAAERAQQEHDETARVKAEAAHLRRVEAIEDTLLDVLEAVLRRVMKKQKPRD